jgi:hypothetical protein
MARYLGCLAVTVLIGAPLCAGELDQEFATKASPARTVQKDTLAPAKASPILGTTDLPPKGSELDGEAPADSGRGWPGGGWHGGWGHGWHGGWGGGWRGGWGWGGGWGYGWGGRSGWYRPWYNYAYWPGYAYYSLSYVAYSYTSPGCGYYWY